MPKDMQDAIDVTEHKVETQQIDNAHDGNAQRGDTRGLIRELEEGIIIVALEEIREIKHVQREVDEKRYGEQYQDGNHNLLDKVVEPCDAEEHNVTVFTKHVRVVFSLFLYALVQPVLFVTVHQIRDTEDG